MPVVWAVGLGLYGRVYRAVQYSSRWHCFVTQLCMCFPVQTCIEWGKHPLASQIQSIDRSRKRPRFPSWRCTLLSPIPWWCVWSWFSRKVYHSLLAYLGSSAKGTTLLAIQSRVRPPQWATWSWDLITGLGCVSVGSWFRVPLVPLAWWPPPKPISSALHLFPSCFLAQRKTRFKLLTKYGTHIFMRARWLHSRTFFHGLMAILNFLTCHMSSCHSITPEIARLDSNCVTVVSAKSIGQIGQSHWRGRLKQFSSHV
jgi:hypothetical protein